MIMSLVSVRYGQPQAVPALAHRLTLLSPSSSPLTQNLFKEAFFQDFTPNIAAPTQRLNFLSPWSSVCVLVFHRYLSELAQFSRYYMPYLYYNTTITFAGQFFTGFCKGIAKKILFIARCCITAQQYALCSGAL